MGFGHRGRSLFGLATRSFPVAAIAICDLDEANLRAARQDYPEAVLFSEFDRLLDEVKLDALLVETPATFHAELCARALARDIYVMSDVPAVATMEEVQALWQAQQLSPNNINLAHQTINRLLFLIQTAPFKPMLNWRPVALMPII